MTKAVHTARAVICVLTLTLCSSAAWAEVRLPAVFGDNMVLQQGVELPVWGTAGVDEEVTVSCSGKQMKAKADAGGKWMVKLPAMQPGGPLEITIVGQNMITLKNVLVGEVWVCSGQSNMAMVVKGCVNADEEIAKAAFPKMRLFTVPGKPADEPQNDCGGKWVECSPQTVGGFSATAFFFGRELHEKLNVPVGLINTSVGGTPAEAWTPIPAQKADPELAAIFAHWDKVIAEYPKALEKHKADMEKWKKAAAEAKAEGKPEPKPPRPPQGATSSSRPGVLYNGMVAPLIPYGIRGAIWYQGEANTGSPPKYQKLLPLMIGCWRQAWGQGDFPFLIVQLPNFMTRKGQPSESKWAEFREVQMKLALLVPKVGVSVNIDIGEADNIHPRNKQDVGKRLALNALANTYGQKIEYLGPLYQSVKVDGDKAIVSFTRVAGGLVSKGDKLVGFAIAGDDKKFVWADAKIEGETVVVSSKDVAKPAAVRYAWADNPDCNLYSKEGLPAAPFRTDAP
ncbi:MAG: sialate O-acetylesterase [Planctomycetota bacterium]|nr:sialate O-acetylesterase [Planctomycetota bacterium]